MTWELAQPIDDPDAERLPWYFWAWIPVVAVSAGMLVLGIVMWRWWALIFLVVIAAGVRAMWRAHRVWAEGFETPEQYDDGDE